MNEQFTEMWRKRNFVVLDTETTGLHRPAEIIDICIIDSKGEIVLNTLIKPRIQISEFITGITGITNDMVEDYAYWTEVKPFVLNAIQGKDVITYNAKFDRHMMHCSDDMWGLGTTDYKLNSEWHCAMEAYAEHAHVWNDFYQNWKWHKLADAMLRESLLMPLAHRAKADAQATFCLLEHLCH